MPIVGKLLKKDPQLMKKAVRWGTFIPVAVTIAFTLVIVGISGAGTTPDALVGVRRVLDDGVVFFSLIFGVLTMTTSIILVSEAVKETLWWDYKVPQRLAWALAVLVPYMMFFFGLRDLTKVISLVGGTAGGLSALMLLVIFLKMKKRPGKLIIYKYIPANGLVYILISIFIIGFIYELYHFLA
jgi:hypothetical protein